MKEKNYCYSWFGSASSNFILTAVLPFQLPLWNSKKLPGLRVPSSGRLNLTFNKVGAEQLFGCVVNMGYSYNGKVFPYQM